MKREILFDKVMKDPESWGDNMDVDAMLDNHEKLKKIMNKMVFSEWPKHPHFFVEVFSNPTFADKLIAVMLKLNITELDKVVFTEYEEEDRKKLVELGILDTSLMKSGMPVIMYCRDDQTCFVNLVL